MSGLQSPLIWNNPLVLGSQIMMEAAPIKSINEYRQDDARKCEAGGILLGYRRDKHLHVVIATVPQVSDKRMRFFFSRSSNYHQQIALQQWNDSGGTIDYLGEWHTHPEVCPVASSLDMLEWKKISRHRASHMLFVILGLSGEIFMGISRGAEFQNCGKYLDTPI